MTEKYLLIPADENARRRKVGVRNRLSIYRIGGLLTVEARVSLRRLHTFKLLIPIPRVWRVRFARH